MPIFLHVTATDWLGETLPKHSWGTEDTIKLAKALAGQGTIDLIDISTRGVHAAQNVNFGPLFQAPFAVAVKQAVSNKLLVSAVGTITNGRQANDLLEEGLDVTLHVNTEISMARQIRWGLSRGGGDEFIDPSVYKPLILDA